MTIMTIKEGNIKKHQNFHYHESTRCLMWVLFWTQWEHGLVPAGCWGGGAVSCAAVRPLLSLSPRLASQQLQTSLGCRPSLGSSLTLPWTQAEAGRGGVYSRVLALRRDLPHYQDLVPLYSSFQCCWISWLGPAAAGADLVCDFWADLCNSWLTPITHGHCPARTAGTLHQCPGPAMVTRNWFEFCISLKTGGW